MADFKYTGQVDKNASPELKQALDDMAKKAYDMQTNPLTKTEAALLYGYGYRLIGASVINPVTIFSIDSINPDGLYLLSEDKKTGLNIDFEDVGVYYHVLVHPLSSLTTEIEGIGVAIDVLNQRALNGNTYQSTEVEGETYLLANYLPEVNVLYNWEGEQLAAWHFDFANFLERGIGKEITLK